MVKGFQSSSKVRTAHTGPSGCGVSRPSSPRGCSSRAFYCTTRMPRCATRASFPSSSRTAAACARNARWEKCNWYCRMQAQACRSLIHIHTFAHAYLQACTHMHTDTHTGMHTYADTHPHMHASIYASLCLHIHACLVLQKWTAQAVTEVFSPS